MSRIDEVRRAERAGDDADRVAAVERELSDQVGDEHEQRADEPGGQERRRAGTDDPRRDRARP